MKSFEKDKEDLMDCKMLRSQDLICLAECKVEQIVKRRMKKMKKQPSYKVFNGWWSMPGGVSVVHE